MGVYGCVSENDYWFGDNSEDHWKITKNGTCPMVEDDDRIYRVWTKTKQYDVSENKIYTSGLEIPNIMLTVVSSNPKVATACFDWVAETDEKTGKKYNYGYLKVHPLKTGKTTFSIYSNDGTGVKATFTVSVVPPEPDK